MKIGDLRELIKEQLFSTRNDKDNVESSSYLNVFKHIPDECELKHSDILRLIEIVMPTLSAISNIPSLLSFINKNNLKTLLLLPYSAIKRVNELITLLNENDLLDQSSFEEILKSISSKLPRVNQSDLVKKSRKNTDEERSEIILDGHVHLFMQHRTWPGYFAGGYGKVKIGYAEASGDNITFGVKKLFNVKNLNTSKNAEREVKYHRLFARQSFFYTYKNQAYIVAEWQFGTKLFDYDQYRLEELNFKERLSLILTGLAELNVLHSMYRVHGDVKCENFILRLGKSPCLKLIDFGSSRKVKNLARYFPNTQDYLDGSNESMTAYNFCDDIYCMGMVIAYFFPELFSIIWCDEPVNIQRTKIIDSTIKEESIYILVDAMRNIERSKRLTCNDALNYCRELVENFDHLDREGLNKIMDVTINKTKIDAADVIHGRLRALI